MAEQIPYGVAVSVINKLASLAFREIGRIYGVSDELEKLKATLESIRVVLSDAEQRQGEDPVIKLWICRFKQVLHDADDLLDHLAIKDLQRKVGGRGKSKVSAFFSSENRFVFRAKLASEIEKIRKNFNDVAEDVSKLKLNSSVVVLKRDETAWRETSSFVLESEIIGREENKNDIIHLLRQTHENQNVSLVAVVGIGGLGKTALAQLVYNDAEVKRVFQKYMWVCVSEDFEVKSVLTKMLKCLKKIDFGDLEVEILQQMLREELTGQRYLFVLDDVWNDSKLKWDALRTYLMCGDKGSKILVTTRSENVAQTMGINNPYVLEGLTKEQSWALLKKVIFGEYVSEMTPNLVSIGERIAKKCRGVPLAIKTIGGLLQSKRLLRSKHEESEWMRILDGNVWSLCDDKESIMPVLKLSYRNLPFELRQCFAYCCLYPKDWEFDRDDLIQLWMAQGCLESSNETQSMEDVGNQYVKILLMRSFFQDVRMDRFGDIKTFKMHDLMHDLATLVAGNDCYLDSEGKGVTGTRRPMHVSFLSCSRVYSLNSLNASKLRTILDSLNASKLRTIIGLKIKDEFVANSSIILNMKCLRVLDLSRSSITKLPEFIGKFKHLRHLDLTCCKKLISLPESIGNLVMLQTLKLNGCGQLVFCVEAITKLISLRHLDLGYCEKLISLPESIGNLVMLQTLKLNHCGQLVFCVEVITKLISLRHLNISYCKAFEKMMPTGLGKIISLQYLSHFMVDDSGSKGAKLNELRDLNDIRGHITISNLRSVKDVSLESQEANLKAKTQIQSLTLKWEESVPFWETEIKDGDSLQLLDNLCPHENLRKLEVTRYPGVRFSSWLPSLTNISDIWLSSFPNCQHFPPLERLPSLETLHIWGMNELKCMYYEEISHVFFPSLKTLHIEKCKNLKGWQRLGDDDDDVNDTQDDDLSLPHFPCLSSLTIEGCPNLTCMPTFPHLNDLILDDCSVKPLIETCSVQHEPSSFNPLSDLKDLKIGFVRHAEAMTEEWMQNLTSLTSLSTCELSLLRHLQWLPSELQELSIGHIDDDKLDLWEYEGDNRTQHHCLPHALRSLQKFSIRFCSNIKALPEQISDLKSLRHITIHCCGKWESLPEAMRCLTDLQTLKISSCYNIKALPEQIGDLKSLRQIDIESCEGLESLPEAMRCLTNLQTLSIFDCPLLYDRCQAETGQDWPKIAHIPNKSILSMYWG